MHGHSSSVIHLTFTSTALYSKSSSSDSLNSTTSSTALSSSASVAIVHWSRRRDGCTAGTVGYLVAFLLNPAAEKEREREEKRREEINQ